MNPVLQKESEKTFVFSITPVKDPYAKRDLMVEFLTFLHSTETQLKSLNKNYNALAFEMCRSIVSENFNLNNPLKVVCKDFDIKVNYKHPFFRNIFNITSILIKVKTYHTDNTLTEDVYFFNLERQVIYL